MGYDGLPEHVKDAIAPYMDVQFSHTIYSIETASEAALELGIENVKANGGTEVDGDLTIVVQPFEPPPGPTEVAFANLIPMDGFWTTDNRIIWEGEWKDLWVKELLVNKEVFVKNELTIKAQVRVDGYLGETPPPKKREQAVKAALELVSEEFSKYKTLGKLADEVNRVWSHVRA